MRNCLVEVSVRDLKTVVGPQRSFYGRSNGLLRAKLESSGEDACELSYPWRALRLITIQVSVKVISDVKDALSIVGDPLCLGRHSVVEKLHAYIRSSINLRHPRINPVLGYILVDGVPSLVSPWCANGNIEAYLQRNAAIDKWTVVRPSSPILWSCVYIIHSYLLHYRSTKLQRASRAFIHAIRQFYTHL